MTTVTRHYKCVPKLISIASTRLAPRLSRCQYIGSIIKRTRLSPFSIADRKAINRVTSTVSFSSVAVSKEDNYPSDTNICTDEKTSNCREEKKHCATCTCDDSRHGASHNDMRSSMELSQQKESCPINSRLLPLPPPLNPPTHSFFKRNLPSMLTPLSSSKGQGLFVDSLLSKNALSYFPLSEQFLNQSDPAYCGLTTLIMVLNAMSLDPQVRWKGGWRWYGNEDMLLEPYCCVSGERVRRIGITVEEFEALSRCQGVVTSFQRPIEENDLNTGSLEQFRKDLIQMVRGGGFLVVSFARFKLGQTGDGHFSPVAAYHDGTDQCLILDVARFKYAPYWVPLIELYEAMKSKDVVTGKSRGWFMMYPPSHRKNESKREKDMNTVTGIKYSIDKCHHSSVVGTVCVEQNVHDEGKRPAELVPMAGEGHICPVGEIKVEYCAASSRKHKDKENGTLNRVRTRKPKTESEYA